MMRRWVATAVAIATLAVPAVATAAPSYQGGCARDDAEWYGYAGSYEVLYRVAGANWEYSRIHDGGYYSGWFSMPVIAPYIVRSQYVGDGHWRNYTVEIQYAVGNGSGWAYGHVAWVSPYNTAPCG